MRKNRIKLNEAQLRQVIKESVKKVLKENTYNEYGIISYLHEKCKEMLDTISHEQANMGLDNNYNGEIRNYADTFGIMIDAKKKLHEIVRKIEDLNNEATEAGELEDNGDVTDNYWQLRH